ncbi:DUF4153 domain-containing protein [Nocardia arizonensis]|uniref:DUF4153 domain-containing protein n=1 Tax=Nocardia arizonensis TaxID=1141647 RepID=UPI001EF5694E|nr:DUF4173 domain-containing protein [Nocardia arizonensis]
MSAEAIASGARVVAEAVEQIGSAEGADSAPGGRLGPGDGVGKPAVSAPIPARPVLRWRRIPRPPGVVPAAAVAGFGAAVMIPVDRPGIGWLLACVVAAGAVFAVDHRARRGAAVTGGAPSEGFGACRERIFWAAIAFGLVAVGAVRAAGWLFALCVAAALVAGSLAVVGRRSVRGAWWDVVAVPMAAFPAVPWALAGTRRPRGGRPALRVGWSVAATAVLLAVFVPLLASADATFDAAITDLLPSADTAAVLRWALVFGLVAFGALGALHLLAGPLPAADPNRQPRRSLRRAEWGLPVGALTALFAIFVAMQFVALFGGDDYVMRTAGLTYAEYARRGFWQLAIVSLLTVAVILAVLRWADRDESADRRWLRGLAGSVSVLSLVIVASSVLRMWTYQDAYGFTVLRLLVGACELWLGLIFLLVIAALVRLDAAWLPRAAIGAAFAALLALAILDPERLVAERNIDRMLDGKPLDTWYLKGLSPDVLPALDRLPEPDRGAIRAEIIRDLPDDSWSSWNLSRARAR